MKLSPVMEYRIRVLKIIAPDVIQDNDGYYVYWPAKHDGAFTSASLKVIASLLDEANRKWDNQVKAHLL